MNSEPKRKISFAEFELDAARRKLMREGKTLPLNAKAFDLLVYLAENAGRVVTKNELLDAVWADQFVEEANLKVQMSALRKALGERRDEHRFLVTIPGKGYKFIADIEKDDGELVIESRRISRVVVEEEIERDTEENQEADKKERNPALSVAVSPNKPGIVSKLAVLGGFAVLVALAFGAYQYFNLKSAGLPFEKIKFTRLTNSGKVSNAALSPDGKYIGHFNAARSVFRFQQRARDYDSGDFYHRRGFAAQRRDRAGRQYLAESRRQKRAAANRYGNARRRVSLAFYE